MGHLTTLETAELTPPQLQYAQTVARHGAKWPDHPFTAISLSKTGARSAHKATLAGARAYLAERMACPFDRSTRFLILDRTNGAVVHDQEVSHGR